MEENNNNYSFYKEFIIPKYNLIVDQIGILNTNSILYTIIVISVLAYIYITLTIIFEKNHPIKTKII